MASMSNGAIWSWWCRLRGDLVESKTVLKDNRRLHEHR
jgi:hypothetical protein